MSTKNQFEVVCRKCGTVASVTETRGSCSQCGEQWLDVVYEYPTNKKNVSSRFDQQDTSMWRYFDMLPISDRRHIVSMGEGWTPLLPAFNLGLMLGHKKLFIKDERQGPTCSFKDRQASMAVSILKQAGITEAVVASTGNVAIAYSAYCARAGIKLWAFIPSSMPAEKMREVALYGTEVIKVTGTYDQTKKVAAEFAKSKNIFLDKGIKGIAAKEAMKTIGYEIAEQLADLNGVAGQNGARQWEAPDWYIQAISGGMGPVGVMKGFQELQQMGVIDKLPKLGCLQVSGCSPMADAFIRGDRIVKPVENPDTDILALATGYPGEAFEVLCQLIDDYGGAMDTVTDQEAFRAMHVLAKIEGISVEAATAVTFAGLFKMIREGVIRPDESVVINCSGHTFPIEKHILGEFLEHNMDLPAAPNGSPSSEEGLLVALERLDERVKRIAIIEDHLDATRLIRRILQAQGEFIIDEAKDGLAGLEMVKKQPPNLIILDLMMPRMDGFSFIEEIKKEPTLSEIPIIVVTAKELTRTEEKKLAGNVSRLLQKGSFFDTDLVGDIRKFLHDK